MSWHQSVTDVLARSPDTDTSTDTSPRTDTDTVTSTDSVTGSYSFFVFSAGKVFPGTFLPG